MIDFQNVSMTYKQSGIMALKDVSFHIDKGEFCFIIGESGAGKSTLIKLLTREEVPMSGQVCVSGYDLSLLKATQIPFLRRNIGMVFQDFRLIETKTVFENVAYAMEIVGASRRQIRRQVPLVLSTVGLRSKEHMRPHELSGGEQQRVAIARAMVNSPMMILADEPTGNLDPATSEAIMVLLSVINRTGTTVVVCTHDHELVNRMQRRVIEFKDGYKIRDDDQGLYQKKTFHEESLSQFDIDQENIAKLDEVIQVPKLRSPFNFIHAKRSVVEEILEDSSSASETLTDRKLAEKSAEEQMEQELRLEQEAKRSETEQDQRTEDERRTEDEAELMPESVFDRAVEPFVPEVELVAPEVEAPASEVDPSASEAEADAAPLGESGATTLFENHEASDALELDQGEAQKLQHQEAPQRPLVRRIQIQRVSTDEEESV